MHYIWQKKRLFVAKIRVKSKTKRMYEELKKRYESLIPPREGNFEQFLVSCAAEAMEEIKVNLDLNDETADALKNYIEGIKGNFQGQLDVDVFLREFVFPATSEKLDKIEMQNEAVSDILKDI
jgi:hypothetical protein